MIVFQLLHVFFPPNVDPTQLFQLHDSRMIESMTSKQHKERTNGEYSLSISQQLSHDSEGKSISHEATSKYCTFFSYEVSKTHTSLWV